jgi:predicted ATPase
MDDKVKGPWPWKQLDGFHRAAESLKLYRRAELQDESTGAALVKQLYVDPLPSSHVLNTLMKANTTFLVGRKGTGKSTVFQRVQAKVRHKSGYASAYVDIKTVYESSSTDPAIATSLLNCPRRSHSQRLRSYSSIARSSKPSSTKRSVNFKSVWKNRSGNE